MAMTDLVFYAIILYFVFQAIQKAIPGSLDNLQVRSFIKMRKNNEVKNDGTDRDYYGLVRSCRANPTKSKRLISVTRWDKDHYDKDKRNQKIGKIIGIAPRNDFTAILIRQKTLQKSKLILCPKEFLTTTDRMEIAIKSRGIFVVAEYFWFPIPLDSSPHNNPDKYIEWVKTFVYNPSNERIMIDLNGDMDYLIKRAQREMTRMMDEIIRFREALSNDKEGVPDEKAG